MPATERRDASPAVIPTRASLRLAFPSIAEEPSSWRHPHKMTLISEFVEALGDAKDAAETVDEVGQPGVGNPASASDRVTAGRAIRLIQLNQNKLTPLLVEEKYRSEAIQSRIRALQEQQEQLDCMREESKEVLETLGILDQQIRQNDFTSGESSEDEEEDEEEEEEEEYDEAEQEGDEQYDREYAAQHAADMAEQKRKLEDGDIELYEENGRIKERRLR